VTSLVQLANERGGPDNISIVVARVRDTEHDEGDTARGLPIITDSMMMDTAQTEVVPIQAATAQMPTSSASTEPSPSEIPTTPGMPAQSAPPTAYPMTPVQERRPQQTLAHPASQRQLATRGSQGRRGGLTLIVVLLFLLVLGVAIGLGLAYVANVPLWPGSAS
jgi:hypothetical protein